MKGGITEKLWSISQKSVQQMGATTRLGRR
jgi:hypothetical protein